MYIFQASHSLNTSHLLAVIATSNTLMAMKNSALQLALVLFFKKCEKCEFRAKKFKKLKFCFLEFLKELKDVPKNLRQKCLKHLNFVPRFRKILKKKIQKFFECSNFAANYFQISIFLQNFKFF